MSCFAEGPLETFNSLLDPYLTHFFSRRPVRKHLLKQFLITKEGRVLEPETTRQILLRMEQRRLIRDRLADMTVERALDLERQRQVAIQTHLKEISKVHRVRKIREGRMVKGDEHFLPLFYNVQRQRSAQDLPGSHDDDSSFSSDSWSNLPLRCCNTNTNSRRKSCMAAVEKVDRGDSLQSVGSRGRRPGSGQRCVSCLTGVGFNSPLPTGRCASKPKQKSQPTDSKISSPPCRAGSCPPYTCRQNTARGTRKKPHIYIPPEYGPCVQKSYPHQGSCPDEQPAAKLRSFTKRQSKRRMEKTTNGNGDRPASAPPAQNRYEAETGSKYLGQLNPVGLEMYAKAKDQCVRVPVRQRAYLPTKHTALAMKSVRRKPKSLLHPASPVFTHDRERPLPVTMVFKFAGANPRLHSHPTVNDLHSEVTVEQQFAGYSSLTIFKQSLIPGSLFSFVSRRHSGFPLALTFYVDGLAVHRMSVCCEFKHKPGYCIEGGQFCLMKAVGNRPPCPKCQVAHHIRTMRQNAERRLEGARGDTESELADLSDGGGDSGSSGGENPERTPTPRHPVDSSNIALPSSHHPTSTRRMTDHCDHKAHKPQKEHHHHQPFDSGSQIQQQHIGIASYVVPRAPCCPHGHQHYRVGQLMHNPTGQPIMVFTEQLGQQVGQPVASASYPTCCEYHRNGGQMILLPGNESDSSPFKPEIFANPQHESIHQTITNTREEDNSGLLAPAKNDDEEPASDDDGNLISEFIEEAIQEDEQSTNNLTSELFGSSPAGYITVPQNTATATTTTEISNDEWEEA